MLRRGIAATSRRLALGEGLRFLGWGIAVFGALLLGLTLLEAGLWFQPEVRTIVFWVLASLLALSVLGAVLPPLFRLKGWLPGLSELETAARIGRDIPEIDDRLVNVLQLADGAGSMGSGLLVDRAVRHIGDDLKNVELESVADYGPARRAGRLAAVPFAALGLMMLISPSTFLDATKRILSPGEFFERPAPFKIRVEPGDVAITKGDPFVVRASIVDGEIPSHVVVQFQYDGEETLQEAPLQVDSAGAFSHLMPNVRRPFTYTVAAGPVLSRPFEVRVLERPMVRGLNVTLTYPRYTRLPRRPLPPNVGDVVGLPGTRVEVSISVDQAALDSAAIVFDAANPAVLEPSPAGDVLTGRFSIYREDAYRIQLTDASGIQNEDPITYSIGVQADAHPSIVLLSPTSSFDLTESMRVPVRVRVADDFGFESLVLHYRMTESRFGDTSDTYSQLEVAGLDPTVLDQEIEHQWMLDQTGLDMVPGDVVSYFLEVKDNDAVAGFKATRTPEYMVRFPSLAEQYDELAEDQSQAESELESLLDDTRQLREEFEEVRDDIREKQDADWDDKRALESLESQQLDVQKRVEEVQSRIEEMSDQMSENSLVSEQTQEMFQELERVMSEIDAPELLDALQKLSESLENLDLAQMQQSLQQFEFSEEQYRERLERAVELFKRLVTQEKLDEAARRAEELAQVEEKLAEDTGELIEDQAPASDDEESAEVSEDTGEDQPEEQNQSESGEQSDQESDPQIGDQSESDQGEQSAGSESEPGEENASPPSESADKEALAERQDAAAEDMEALEQLMEEIRSRMEDLSNAPQDEMDHLQDEMQQKDLQQQMQENSQQLRDEQLQEAQKGQQSMQQQLSQMQQQLSQMQQQMSSEQNQLNLAGLRRVLDDVLTLSGEQEAMRGEMLPFAPDNPALREYAQQQSELSDGLETVADTLGKLAASIPQMSRVIQQETGAALLSMERTITEMAERQVDRSTSAQKESMTHLNNLALLIADLMDQLSNSGGSGGQGGMSMEQMMQQLQQMAGQQQQLNQQIQQMLNDMVGNRLSTDQQARMQQLAQQQEALRQQLNDMANNGQLNEQVLGDLNKIARQMEESIQELQRQELGRPTTQRQIEILTRLLDAQRSMRQRGKSEQRESKTGADEDRDTPGDISPSEQADQLRRDLIRALESGYAPDYEELIKRYFELLQEGDEQR